MIELLWPPARLAWDWPKIAAVLKPAVELDKARDWFEVAGRLLSGTFQAWRFDGGYFVTETYQRGPFWIMYVAGSGGSIADKRALLAEIETAARKAGSRTIKFDGRDWRRIAEGYKAERDADGIWHFEKRL